MIKEGERLTQIINKLERDANNRAVKGAQGRTKALIALNDKLETSYDHTLNKIDEFTLATRRLEKAQQSLESVQNRTIRTEEDAEKQVKDLEAAENALAGAMQNLVYKGQALTKAVRDETRARKDLNDENKKYTKNASAVTRVTNKNKSEFRNLASATTRARNQLQSLHDTNLVHVKDNTQVAKGMRRVSDATKNTTRERKKYKDLLKTEGVTAKQIEAQTLRVKDAFEAETRAVQDLRVTMTEAIGKSTKFISVQDRARVALSAYSVGLGTNDAALRRQIAANRSAIDSSRGLTKVFDSASDSVVRHRRDHDKLIEMMNDSTTSSSALAAQIDRTSDSYQRMERSIRDSSSALKSHLIEEAKSAARSPFGRGGRRAPDIEGSLARNLGALTPLGTVSPGLLIPLGAAFVALAQGVVAASQSLLILPGALTAAGAGFGVMQMATMGVSDALTAMMDFNNPEKFAESLRLLSPAAQQFALSIQQLIPTFMEMKNVVQDTFFAGLPEVVNGLAQTYRDAFGGMAIGVSQAFNDIFKTIGSVLQDPRAQQAVGVMFDGIVQSFRALIPLIPPLTQLFVQIAGMGAQVLPSIIDDITAMTSRFAEFINTASASGELKNWMMEGWEALKAVGSVIVYTGRMLYEVFGLHGPDDIERFKATLFGIVDGFGVFFGALEKFFTGLVRVFNSITQSGVGQFIGAIIEKFGGLETILAGLAGGMLVGKIIFSFRRMFKFIEDAIAFTGLKIAGLRAALLGLPAAAGAAGTAAGTAAAAGVAAGGAAAGAGFASKLKTVLKGAGWVGIGVAIADAIGQGMRDGKGGWRDALADGLDPGKVFNIEYWIDKIRGTNESGLNGPRSSLDVLFGGKEETPAPDPLNPTPAGSVVGNDGKPYQPVQPGTPGSVPIPGKNQWGVPGTMGSTPSGGREPDRPFDFSDIPGIPAGGFPVPTPNPGGGPTPNIPLNQYSLQNIPLGQFGPALWTPPDPRSLMSQLTPNQLSQQGYGYVVDPQGIFDAETQVMQQRAAVEEARARVLELEQDNQATEQEKLKARNNIIETERSYLKSQVQLLEAQRGTWKKINESTSDQAEMLKGLGAEIDADFGISKGLPGIAENIVKFLANITAAPVYGALAGMRAAGGDTGGGKGLVGAAALSGAFGPQFMQPAPNVPAAGTITYGPSTPGAPSALTPGPPLAAEVGFTAKPGTLNPRNVSTAGLQPQSMALLSLIQGMSQFAGIPLVSGYRVPGNPADQKPGGGMYPWHPSGRGLDLGLNANDPIQSALGDQLNSFLNANKQMFGIENTLWKVKDHFDHLHIALKEGASPLMQNQALNGITPPSAGAGATTASLGSGSIPIPLPVTIVGGAAGTAGLPAAGSSGVTPPPGTPGAPLAPGGKPGGAGGATAGGQPLLPAAGPPGGTPGTTGSMKDGSQTKVWTVNPDGTVSWHSFYGNPAGPPPGQPGKPATTPGTSYVIPGSAPAALPSPGQGGPVPWTLPPLAPAGAGPTVPAPGAGGPPLAPGGYTPPGIGPTQIGAVVGPPEGTGGGFAGVSGGILGAAQGAIGAAAGAAGAMAGGGGGAALGALAQIGIEELNRAIAFAGQAAGIGVSGLMETFLPTGGSELANNGWLPKILGGIVGARPLLPNFANISGASNDVQAKQNAGNTPQDGVAGNVNVTQNNYNQNGNSATSDLERLATNAAAASMPAMGVR